MLKQPQGKWAFALIYMAERSQLVLVPCFFSFDFAQIQNVVFFSFSASDKNYYDPRDISRVKSDDYFVEQFINAKEGNVDKAHKIMVLSVREHF